MRLAAQIFSTLFHPLLVPVIGLLIIFNTDSYLNYAIPADLKKAIVMLVVSSTFIIPLLVTLLLLNRKIIQSLEMVTIKERIIPYAFTLVFYIFTLLMLREVSIPPIIFDFVIGATLSVLVAFVVNLKWKISAHMIGVGGLLGALICISTKLEVYLTPHIIVVLLVSGLVGSSRLILKSHTPSQVYTGFALGVLCQVISILS